LVLMGAVFVLAALFTQFLSNVAATVLLAPIALSMAQGQGLGIEAFLLAVAFGASMSFATSVATPANTMVMSPGGYAFVDYLKVGVPLTLVCFVVAIVLLPIVYRL
jgi:di/tricarboxylate transporter